MLKMFQFSHSEVMLHVTELQLLVHKKGTNGQLLIQCLVSLLVMGGGIAFTEFIYFFLQYCKKWRRHAWVLVT